MIFADIQLFIHVTYLVLYVKSCIINKFTMIINNGDWAHLALNENNSGIATHECVDTRLYNISVGSTAYGVILRGHAEIEGRRVNAGEFFCRKINSSLKILLTGKVVLFIKNKFQAPEVIAGIVEDNGRVNYIDGCKDSLLLAPATLGDPCLNALYFPPGVTQTFHTHPSIRAGAVLRGNGWADHETGTTKLETGDTFWLPIGERHRFRTENESMTVIAYHPDSDWGPIDEVHPMINRTIIL